MSQRKYIVSGGGTGGHVFPAIAIADALRKKDPSCDILFVGAIGKLEMQKVPEAGYPIEGLKIAGLQRRLTIKNLSFPFKLLSSLWRAKKIVKKFNPDVVIGVGGYASGPVLKMASKRRIPTVLQEQNSHPGLTNRLLAKTASKICVAFEGLEKYFPSEKIVMTGNPVREDIVEIGGKREKALAHFKLNDAKKVILVIGGSLGAKTLNDSILSGLNNLKQENVQLIWQCGKYYYEQLKGQIGVDEDVKLHPFIKEMDFAYAAADVIISRAGALSVSELCLIKKASILIPSPNVSEDHQTKNAMALVKKDATILIKDDEARGQLVQCAKDLLHNEAEIQKLQKNIGALARPKAADAIANEIMKLID